MSSLINDLNQIYNVKGQIKEVANIPTDVFSDFPTYIAAAIASGGATGEIEITTNGTHDVSTYASAYVNVPQEEVPVVPPGYSYVEGTINIIENGTVDVSSYANAYVQVPIPEGFIYPTGYAYVTTNGDFPIREFQYVNVNVPTSGGLDWDDVAEAGYIVPAGTLNVIANGTVDVSAYENATVNVPIPSGYIVPSGTINFTENSNGLIWDISSYASATVNVPTGVVPTGTKTIAENGTHDIASYAYAYVNVPIPSGYIVPAGTYNITVNGNYNIASYAYVDVQLMSGHDGLSAENAYTVAEAISRFSIASQDDFIYGSWLSDVTYVTGIISKIHEISTQYHNCTFTISDDGTYEVSGQYVDGADNLLLYRQGMEAGVWNMPSDTAPKVGDKITLYGKWTGTTNYVIDEGFSTYWDNGANAYCGVSSLYREAPRGGYTVTQNGSELDLSSYSYVTVNVAGGGSTGTYLTEVFGADENNANVYIPFDDEGEQYTYAFSFDWDGENWSGDGAGFSLVGRLGNATQYDYDDQQDDYVLHNSYTALQMHVANGSFYLGDYIGSLEPEYDPEDPETLIPTTGGIDIATDLYPNTKFLNNGFGASPDNLDMSAWAGGTLDFFLIVPKNLAVNYGSGVDAIEDGTARYITHPIVTLNWEWSGELVPETFTCPNCGAEIDHEPESGNPCPDCGYPDNEEPEEEPEE